MKPKNKIFLCTYTSDKKRYCDEQFFKTFNSLDVDIRCIVDNTQNTEDYYNKLLNQYTKDLIFHLDIETDPAKSLFQRRVYESVNKCREEFLKTDCQYFLIIESDVIPPENILDLLEKDIEHLEQSNSFHSKPWGIIGGLYYVGFHDFTKHGLHETHHCLSGCTLYKRSLIEKYPFRYNEQELGSFPDAWICFDSGIEYSLWNDYNIHCQHIEIYPGNRQL